MKARVRFRDGMTIIREIPEEALENQPFIVDRPGSPLAAVVQEARDSKNRRIYEPGKPPLFVEVEKEE